MLAAVLRDRSGGILSTGSLLTSESSQLETVEKAHGGTIVLAFAGGLADRG